MAHVRSIPMDIDETPSLLETTALVDWRGWTIGPARLSQLTVRTVCRETCLAAAHPDSFEDEDPFKNLEAKGASRGGLANRASLQQYGRSDGQDRTAAARRPNPKWYSKLDAVLAQGQPDDGDLAELFDKTTERIERLSKWLPKPGGAVLEKSFSYVLMRDDKACCARQDVVTGRTLTDEYREEISNVIVVMAEFENSPLASFFLTLVTGSTQAQLAKWNKKKTFFRNPTLPTSISGLFGKVLPKLPKGFITELRLVNVEITDHKAFEQLMIFCHDHLVLMECGLPSSKHLNSLVQFGDRLKHLKIEGLLSPLPVEDVTLAFFRLSVNKLRGKYNEGPVWFPLPNLQSIHFVDAVDCCQNMVLTCMAQSSPALKSVMSNHKPISLKPSYPHSSSVCGIEELFIEGRKVKHFVKKFTLSEVFPRLRHVHLMGISFKAPYMETLLNNRNLVGFTFYCSSVSDFGKEWIGNLFSKFVTKRHHVESLGFKVYNSLCYNVIWSLLIRLNDLRFLTLDHSARSVSTMNEQLYGIQLFYLEHLCYRKTAAACYSRDTGKFLALLLKAAPCLRRLQLHIAPSEHHDLQLHIVRLDVQLRALGELSVCASEDSDVYINDIVWMLDRFPTIDKLEVQVGSESVLQELRRRMQHTHVSISAEPDTPFM